MIYDILLHMQSSIQKMPHLTHNATSPPYQLHVTTFPAPNARPRSNAAQTKPQSHLFPLLLLRRLRSFLPITPYHHHAKKTPHYRSAQQEQDYWDPDGPDARGEEGLRCVGVVYEGLSIEQVRTAFWFLWGGGGGGGRGKGRGVTIKRVQMV